MRTTSIGESRQRPRSLWPLGLVIAALPAGLLLGPLVLGRVAPSLHQRLFVGGDEARHALAEHDAAARDRLARLGASGVTETALAETLAADAAQRRQLQQQLDHALGRRTAMHRQLAAGLLLGLMGLLVLETLIDPHDGRGLVGARLRSLRGALLALWLVFYLASGPTLRPAAAATAGVILLAALAIALGPRRRPAG